MTKSNDYSGMSDQKLVENISSCQDDPAFEELWSRYHRKMYQRCISHHGLREQDAEDVTMITATKIWSSVTKFTYKTHNEFQGWLNKILKHAVIDFMNTEKTRQGTLSTISLNSDIRTDNGSSLKWEEVIPDIKYDVFIESLHNRDHILEIAKRKNVNSKEMALLRQLLFGEPLPSSTSKGNWAKIKSRLTPKLRVWLKADFD